PVALLCTTDCRLSHCQIRIGVAMRQVYCSSLLLLLLLVSLGLRSPTAALAQSMPPDLIVTLRDVYDAPVAGVTTQVRASADGPVLAQAVTDANGAAEIAGLTVDRVLVVVIGSL